MLYSNMNNSCIYVYNMVYSICSMTYAIYHTCFVYTAYPDAIQHSKMLYITSCDARCSVTRDQGISSKLFKCLPTGCMLI